MKLSAAQAHQYREQGYLCPIAVMSPAQAAALRARLEAAEAANGGPLQGAMKQKPHLLFTFLDELVRHPAVLDAVEGVLGPDILCWASGFFTKEAHDPSYVTWHQDLTYWGLEPADIVSAWIALAPSTALSGCMRVVPGSHLQDVIPHAETFAPHNLLSRGQEVQVEVDPAQAVDLVLEPGQMSLHHVKLIHGSLANRSDDRRIGFVVRYVPTHVRQTAGSEDSALLVRGTDREHNFLPEQPPAADLDAAALAEHALAAARAARILMRGTGREGVR